MLFDAYEFTLELLCTFQRRLEDILPLESWIRQPLRHSEKSGRTRGDEVFKALIPIGIHYHRQVPEH